VQTNLLPGIICVEAARLVNFIVGFLKNGGHSMAGKYGSNRVGWNQRGPSDKDLFDQAKARSEQSNPESYYWQNKTHNMKFALIDAMGEDEFVAYAESIFPGDTIDDFTWRQIFETYEAKLEQVNAARLDQEAGSWIN
jgi:hypothetical protein